MAHKSIAMSDVQSRRDNVVIPNGGHLHSYANAYFNPRNPMMYKRKDMAETLCVLAISALVLDCAGTIISDGNAASAYGPYSAEVKESITTLSNANLMVESQHVGQNMVETRVTPNFTFDPSLYTSDELQCLNKTVDLFCRIKNTDQAEMMATIMFSYDRLKLRNAEVTEEDVLRDVLDWKKRWVGVKEDEIRHTIRALSILGWLQPKISFPVEEEY